MQSTETVVCDCETCACMHACMHVCLCVCVSVCVSVPVCMHACVCVYMCACSLLSLDTTIHNDAPPYQILLQKTEWFQRYPQAKPDTLTDRQTEGHGNLSRA